MSLNPLSSWLADEPIDPVFLAGVRMGPTLRVAATKRDPDRFRDFEHSAFDYGSISDRGSERAMEVRAEEHADQLRAIWGDDDGSDE